LNVGNINALCHFSKAAQKSTAQSPPSVENTTKLNILVLF